MGLYETNYSLINHLIPDFMRILDHGVSSVSRGENLYLCVLDCSRYTSSIQLTHRFTVKGNVVYAPGLSIRIYFDTNQAEVLAWQGQEDFAHIDPNKYKTMSSVAAKWQVNQFLSKWLRFCLNIGHRFASNGLAARREHRELLS